MRPRLAFIGIAVFVLLIIYNSFPGEYRGVRLQQHGAVSPFPDAHVVPAEEEEEDEDEGPEPERFEYYSLQG